MVRFVICSSQFHSMIAPSTITFCSGISTLLEEIAG